MRPHLIVFGFPVQFGTSAIVFMGLGYFFAQWFGLSIVVAFIGSTLLHELGHAFAFRHYGCTSAITVHGFGGMTSSYDAHGLTHKEHIVVSLAGPLAQLLLIGAPLLIALPFSDFDPLVEIVVYVLVLVNVGWALANLLPIYPLDGGQVLYRMLAHRDVRHAWRITTVVSLLIAVPASILAYQAGYRFAVLIIGYTLWQGLSQREPATAKNPIRDAAARARGRHQPLKATGRQGDHAVAEAYQQLANGNDRRVDALLDVLDGNKKRSGATTNIRAWQRALAQVDHEPGEDRLLGLVGAESIDTAATAAALIDDISADQVPVATVLLQRREAFPDVLQAVPTTEALRLLEDRLLHSGLAPAQMAVARELRLRAESGESANR